MRIAKPLEAKKSVVMAKWGPMKWKCSTKKIMPVEDDLNISCSVNEKNKKEKQKVGFSYVPAAEMGVNVYTEIQKWDKLLGKSHPLYVGTKRIGPRKLKLKSVNVSDISVYGSGKITRAGISLEFEEKRKKEKKTSKKKKGTTKSAKKTAKKKAKSK